VRSRWTRTRRELVAGTLCLLGLACSGQEEPAGTPPSKAAARSEEQPGAEIIILISLDTLRADHLGVYGHSRFTSPVLDQFAAEGVVFEDASATSPWTLPSHASILTGLYPERHGVTTSSTALPDRIPTLATLLKARGYRTAAIVNTSWLKQDTFRLTRDFDHYLEVKDSDYRRRTPTRWVTDEAMSWLGEHPGERLFLFMHYYDLHADYASMPHWEKLFVTPYEGLADGTAWQLQRANFADEHIALCQREFDPEICQFGSREKPRVIDQSVQPFEFGALDIRRLEELYDAGIRQLDTELGRFFSFLEEHELAEGAVVIVTSDHGEEFLEHGRVDHFLTTYQEVLQVPLLIRGPGIPSGVRIALPVSSVDIAPTVLGRAAAGPPTQLDGLDLEALWAPDEAASEAFEGRFLYGEATGGIQYGEKLAPFYPVYRSVRKGRYKLVFPSPAGGYALYDLSADPREQIDIAAAEPEITAELTAQMKGRLRARGDPVAPRDRIDLDPEQKEELRALGYAVP